MRSAPFAFLVLALSAITCAGPSSPASGPKTVGDVKPMAGGDTTDIVTLKNGQKLEGTIVGMDNDWVVIRTADKRLHPLARKDIIDPAISSDHVDSGKVGLTERPDTGDAKSRAALPPSSWAPRLSSQETVTAKPIDFLNAHPWKDSDKAKGSCVGQLAEVLEKYPELCLFGEPGGKLIVRDPILPNGTTRGWHAHVFSEGNDTLAIPKEKGGFTVEFPKKGLPHAVALATPAVEYTRVEDIDRTGGDMRKSWGISDAAYAQLKDLSACEATLAAQPFAGGQSKETSVGRWWAFGLPRGSEQFWLCVWAPDKKHGKILEASFAAYGDKILLPDLMLDLVAADGTQVGRVFLLPVPPTVSADGPAPEPVALFSGEGKTVLGTVPLPPRHAIVPPPKAPSTKATIYVNCYEVTDNIPQRLVTAWGLGRPNSGVTIAEHDLKAETEDQQVKIDLSKKSPDDFPAVAWLVVRRNYVWAKTGGYLPPALPLLAPTPRAKPTGGISHEGRPSHALPILFVGPKSPAAGGDPGTHGIDDSIAAGTANGLTQDLLRREAGLPDFLAASNALSNLVPKGEGGGGSSASATTVNNINVYVQHGDTGLPTGSGTGTGTGSSSELLQGMTTGGANGLYGWTPDMLPYNQGNLTSRPAYWVPNQNGPNYPGRSSQQQATYDPTTGSTSQPSSSNGGGGSIAFDPVRGAPVFGVMNIPTKKK